MNDKKGWGKIIKDDQIQQITDYIKRDLEEFKVDLRLNERYTIKNHKERYSIVDDHTKFDEQNGVVEFTILCPMSCPLEEIVGLKKLLETIFHRKEAAISGRLAHYLGREGFNSIIPIKTDDIKEIEKMCNEHYEHYLMCNLEIYRKLGESRSPLWIAPDKLGKPYLNRNLEIYGLLIKKEEIFIEIYGDSEQYAGLSFEVGNYDGFNRKIPCRIDGLYQFKVQPLVNNDEEKWVQGL